MSIVTALLFIVCVLLCVPVLVVAVQVLMARPSPARLQADTPRAPRPSLTVLMPAHDESAGVAAAVLAVLPQLLPADRLLVVADNCSDDTAAIAASAGAEVIERHDTQRRGKGYALDHGVRAIEARTTDIVIVVDADCHVQPGALDLLARECGRTGRPVQALYLMEIAPGGGLKARIARFAWELKNHVRPLGFRRLGLPCQLMGTGMAFPWPVIRTAPLASGHIVEDMQLGLDLARDGKPPLFCAGALVTSTFPSNEEGSTAQRTRWEHGHLGVIASNALPMIGAAVMRMSPSLFFMALDLCVPPLAALVLSLAGVALVALLLGAIGGSWAPLVTIVCGFAVLTCALAIAWSRFGRQIIAPADLAGIPAYVLGKFSIYRKLFGGRQIEWVRTKRDEGPLVSGDLPPAVARQRVSVAMATYNGARYLREQLESIGRQTLLPQELVISDDASTDDTIAICETFAASVPFPVRVIPNGSGLSGVVGNFLNAFDHCNGELIAYCDQDDVWDPQKLEICVRAFADPRVSLVIHRSRIVDESLNDLGHSLYDYARDHMVAFPTFIHAVGGFGHQMVFDRRVLPLMRWLRASGASALSRIADGFDPLIPTAAGMLGNVQFIARDLTRFRRHGHSVSSVGKAVLLDAHTWRRKLAGKRGAVSVLGIETSALASVAARDRHQLAALGVNAPAYAAFVSRLASHFAARDTAYRQNGLLLRLAEILRSSAAGAYASFDRGGCGLKALAHDLAAAICGVR